MILMIDNYDSFTYNLVQYLGELGADVIVERNDQITIEEIEALAPERIMLSPGPCTPAEAGISLDVIKHFQGKLPIFGVCLGHQSIGQAFGGDIIRAKKIMHGKTSTMHHKGIGIFENIPGLGGLDEIIEEYKSIDSNGIYDPANKARYHRRYTTGRDAVGRGAYINGWNDPTLITAFTKNSQIVHGTSYMIPLELILRTPLETWNPNDLELKSRSAITGSGTASSPYNGFAENFYNYHTPAEFYAGFDGTDPADTGKGAKAIRNMHGDVSNYIASGIWIVLPKIKELQERVRVRFPIFWNANEFSPSNIMLSAYMKENNEIMDYLQLQLLTKRG